MMKRSKQLKNISGDAVRRLRTLKGLSQRQLAEKCQLVGWDVSRDIIAKIEGKTRWVSDMELVKLSKALKVDIGSIVK